MSAISAISARSSAPRIGWYLEPTAPAIAAHAVRVGGVLGCVDAAESYGMFIPEGLDGRIHVSVAPDTTRMRSSADASRHVHAGEDPAVRLHWDRRIDSVRGWRVSPADALLQMAQCTTSRWLTAAVDSARNTAGDAAILEPSSLPILRAALPDRLAEAVDRSDPLSEAVGETFIRLELDDRRIPRRPQAWLTSLYRTDVLVDEWLPVESDGVKHHSGKAVVRDRERDAVLAYLDRQPLRFTHASAVHETAWVGDVVERVWRRGR
jgi:very-short-patch-repair endonuclease